MNRPTSLAAALLALSAAAAPAAFINLTPVPSPQGSAIALNPTEDPTAYFYVTTEIEDIKSIETPDRSEAPPKLEIRSTREIVDETAKRYSENALRKAKLQLGVGDFDETLSSIDQALSYDPHNPEAITLRGVVSAKRRRWGAAIDDYTAAIKHAPDYHPAYHSRAIARTQIKQFEAALTDYDTVVRLEPTFPEAYHKRGMLHAQQGDFEKALADFDTYIGLRPADPLGYNNKVAALVKLGRRDEADATYKDFVRVQAEARKRNRR